MGIHYCGHKGYDIKRIPNKISFEEYVKNGGVSRHLIKKKLLREGLKEHKCECCGLTEWMGQPIPLELHHENGDQTNVAIENLRLLCPNCHSFTDNYRGKGIKKIFYCPKCGNPISKKGHLCRKCAAKERAKHYFTICPEKEILIELLKNNSILQIGNKYAVSDNTVRKWCKKYDLPFKHKDILQWRILIQNYNN